MWALLWLFLWGGLIIIVVTMITVGRWMYKHWDYDRPTDEQERSREEVITDGIENLRKQDELTKELNQAEWYPYYTDEEGNTIPKSALQ